MKTTSHALPIGLISLLLAACGGGGGNQEQPTSAVPQETKESVNDTTYRFEAGSTAYSLQLLGTLGEDSYAVALNDASQIVGNYLDTAGRVNAFFWENGTMRPLATSAHAEEINSRGEVVGWLEPSGLPEAFHATGSGQVQKLSLVSGATQALTINDQGSIAGRIGQSEETPFLTSGGQVRTLAADFHGYAIAMNDAGQILLKKLTADGFRTLLWENGTLTDLGDFGGKCTQGLDINEIGQVVGWSQTASGDYHAFLWQDGVMTDLVGIAGNFSSAVAINDHGEILIKFSDLRGQGNLLITADGSIDLGNFGSSYAVANDLNNRSEIAGWLLDQTGKLQAFLATPLAEEG